MNRRSFFTAIALASSPVASIAALTAVAITHRAAPPLPKKVYPGAIMSAKEWNLMIEQLKYLQDHAYPVDTYKPLC